MFITMDKIPNKDLKNRILEKGQELAKSFESVCIAFELETLKKEIVFFAKKERDTLQIRTSFELFFKDWEDCNVVMNELFGSKQIESKTSKSIILMEEFPEELKEYFLSQGNEDAEIYGGNCHGFYYDMKNDEMVYECMEHGEAFVMTKPYKELFINDIMNEDDFYEFLKEKTPKDNSVFEGDSNVRFFVNKTRTVSYYPYITFEAEIEFGEKLYYANIPVSFDGEIGKFIMERDFENLDIWVYSKPLYEADIDEDFEGLDDILMNAFKRKLVYLWNEYRGWDNSSTWVYPQKDLEHFLKAGLVAERRDGKLAIILNNDETFYGSMLNNYFSFNNSTLISEPFTKDDNIEDIVRLWKPKRKYAMLHTLLDAKEENELVWERHE